ncbi:MAG TPA: group II intron reverse transcriptase/maturase [Verrucomicrobiae bacterium]|nr:group II intron reverse transcriptase/maturase [Verrucomicrobiae bacterium]
MEQNDESQKQTDTSACAKSAAKPVGNIRLRWKWVERSVWTDRMLVALETGVKGGKWYSLIDKVWNEANLLSAWLAVAANDGAAGVDRQSVAAFQARCQSELGRLSEEIREGRYKRQAARRVWIDKPGSTEQRPLGIPCVRDRVTEGAIRQVIEPIFEREFAQHSYGFRPGRSAQEAVGRVERLLKEGYTWVVDADIKSYFDRIPRTPLLTRVAEHVSDRQVLGLIEQSLSAGVMEEMKGWQPTEQGTPQGGVLSPLLANIYLNPLDWLIAQAGYHMTRYADDFVIQCRTREEAEQALTRIQTWMSEAGLTLHPEKTRIVDSTQKGGFDFLGWHFERGHQWPREKSQIKLKEAIRELTPRNSGKSLREIMTRVNLTLKGWRAYFDHGVRNVHEDLDGMVRRRLRKLMLKRRGKRGTPQGNINRRWPNAYFDKLGLWRLAGPV